MVCVLSGSSGKRIKNRLMACGGAVGGTRVGHAARADIGWMYFFFSRRFGVKGPVGVKGRSGMVEVSERGPGRAELVSFTFYGP